MTAERRLIEQGAFIAIASLAACNIPPATFTPAMDGADAAPDSVDIAIESSDITLVRGELSAVVSAVKLSYNTFRKVKQNLFWAFFYNLIAIPVAIMGLLHPVMGMSAMAISSLFVVTNSLMLKRANLEPSYKSDISV